MATLPTRKLETGHWQILDHRYVCVAEAMLDPRYPGDREPWRWYMLDDSADGRSPLKVNAVSAVYHQLTSR